MKMLPRIFQPFLILLVLFFVSSVVLAKGSELEFKAAIAAINQPAEGDSTVIVSLFSESSDFDITIIVDTNTKIESNGNEINLSELEIGDYIKVSAFFSDVGIVAEEIDLLDGRIGQFRLRGLIDGVSSKGDGTLVELLGVSVLVNSATRIRDRSRDEDGTVDSLIVGQLIDAKGRVVDDVFVAKRIILGQRREGHVEFDGVITQSGSNLLSVETHNGTILSVVIDGDTKIRGNLFVGAYIEVDGFLNEQLQVVADKIKVDDDGNGDAGDDDRRDKRGHNDDDDGDKLEVAREVSFQNMGGSLGIEGKVKFKYELEDSSIEQELEVEIEHAVANTSYGMSVGFAERVVDFGILTTNDRGRVKVEFEDSPKSGQVQINNLLPDGKDVRDIQQVQITLDGNPVLEAKF